MTLEISGIKAGPSPAADALREKPGRLLEHLIKSHAADLNEGAADRLREAVQPDRQRSPASAARAFFDHLHGPQGYRLMKYGAGPDPAKSPVLHVAERLPFKDAKAAASRLEMHLADLARPGERPPIRLGLSTSTPDRAGPRWGEIAAAMVNAAGIGDGGAHGPDVSDLLAPGWAETFVDPRESRLMEILDSRFTDVGYSARRRIAKDLASSVGGQQDYELVRRIADQLTRPLLADRYGAPTLGRADPRLNEWPPRRADPPARRSFVG